MEPTAAALAAKAATDEDRQALRHAWEAMVAARDNDAFVVADIAFHKRLYISSRNEFFWPIAQMFEVTLRESFRLAALGDHRPRAFEEHREVMEAIRGRRRRARPRGDLDIAGQCVGRIWCGFAARIRSGK